MPDSLSHQLSAGQTADLDRTFYNDVVERFNSADRAGPVDVALSTEEATVHPDSGTDYALIPDGVALRDHTDWGGMSSERVLIEWSLETGPGHLTDGSGPATDVETGPGESITWDWHHSSETSDPYYDTRETRAWDAMPGGNTLPDDVDVQITGKVLTEPVHGSSVATSSDLANVASSDASDGDQRLVRDTRTVYKLDTSASSGDVQWSGGSGYWVQQSGSFYTTVGTVHRQIQVTRAYDPDRVPGTRIRLRPSQEIAYLDGDGTAGMLLYDDSAFNDDATEVNRTVTAQFEGQPQGEGMTLTDKGSTEEESGNLDGTNDLLSNSDWHEIGVTAQAAGELTITAEYDVTTGQGTETHTTKRRIQIVPAPDPAMEATTEPDPPAHELIPTRGRPEVHLGEPIKITSITETGSFFDGTFELKWSDARAAEVARRLDLDDLQVRESVADENISIEREQIELLNRAGTLLNAALGQATSHGLSTYEIAYDTGYNDPGLEPKNIIRAGGATLRVQESLGDGVAEVIGMKPTGFSAPETGHVTGTGKWFVVDMEAGYGTPGSGGFPQRTVHATEIVDPVAGPNEAGLTLPQERPDAGTDGWHVRYNITARWESGAAISTGWTSWADAEPVPEGSPSVTLEKKSDGVYEASIGGSPDEFYGAHGWRAVDEVPTGAPDSADRALSGGKVPPTVLTQPPIEHGEGSVYFLEGHFRTEAGTCQPQVKRVLSREVSPDGLPIVSTDSDQPPQDVEVPAANGVILKGPSRKWISVEGSWTPVGAGPERITVTNAQVIANGSVQGNTVQSSPTKWTGSADFPATNQMTIRFFVEGGVGSVETVQKPAGALTFDQDAGTVDVEFGMQEQFHGDSLRFVLRLVPSGSAAEEKVIEYVLDDSSATNLGEPEIYSVDATGKKGTTPDDNYPKKGTDADGNTMPYWWDVKHSDSWTGLTMNLLLKNVSNVADVRRTDGSDYDWAYFDGHMPPYVNITSQNPEARFEVDVENASGTTNTYTIDVFKP